MSDLYNESNLLRIQTFDVSKIFGTLNVTLRKVVEIDIENAKFL